MISATHIFLSFFFFFFNDTATTEIYTLSLHDALPISFLVASASVLVQHDSIRDHLYVQAELTWYGSGSGRDMSRSEEHTSELQSQSNLVCRLLLEKKKKQTYRTEWNQPYYTSTSYRYS